MRVLIVEDDPDLARQLKAALSDAGYAIDHAPDGEEAHYLGETEPYDAIVLDLGLPVGDGYKVLERLRAIDELADIPVVVLSGQDPGIARDKALAAGARAFLSKPASPQQLLDAVGIAP